MWQHSALDPDLLQAGDMFAIFEEMML